MSMFGTSPAKAAVRLDAPERTPSDPLDPGRELLWRAQDDRSGGAGPAAVPGGAGGGPGSAEVPAVPILIVAADGGSGAGADPTGIPAGLVP